MRVLRRSTGKIPRTHEKQFRDDGSIAARPVEHSPKHALAWWRSPSNLPCSLTATGSICRLNPDTASGHTVAETCAAPLRRMLRSGLAMLARKRLSGIPSHQKEKFGSLRPWVSMDRMCRTHLASFFTADEVTTSVVAETGGVIIHRSRGVAPSEGITGYQFGPPSDSGNQPFLFRSHFMSRALRCLQSTRRHAFSVEPTTQLRTALLLFLGCRGGFGTAELIAFLYARSFPKEEWDQRFHEALNGMKRK